MPSAQAATTTWTGAGGDSKWNTAANWSGGAVPTSTDDVVVSGFYGPVTTADISFQSLYLNGGATLNLYHKIVGAGSMTVSSSQVYFRANVVHTLTGKVKLTAGSYFITPVTTNTPNSAIRMEAGEFDIDAGTTVTTYRSGYLYGQSGMNGSGPYPGTGNSGGGGGGGGVGGAGGTGGAGTAGGGGGTTACATLGPTSFGSGGGGGDTDAQGGNGGGLIHLVANNTSTINGTITSVGENQANTGMSFDGGGGGGGAIRLYAKDFLGTPEAINAAGGNGGSSGGGGGGGCVELGYEDTNSITTGMMSVLGGTGSNAGSNGVKRIVQLPLRPLNFAVGIGPYNGVTSSEHTLSWTSAGGIGTMYNIYYSEDGLTYIFYDSTSTPATSYTTTNLQPGRHYYYRITSVSSTVGASSYASNERSTRYVTGNASSTITSLTSNTVGLALNAGVNYVSPDLGVLSLWVSSTAGQSTPINFEPVNTAGTILYGQGNHQFTFTDWGGTVRGLYPSTTYNFSLRWIPQVYGGSASNIFLAAITTTLLATPPAPTFLGESSTTLNLSWTDNGNPTTTPYAVYNETLGQYHLNDGTLSVTPVFSPRSSWNGTAKQLSPGTLYNFRIILRKEDGSQYATSTAAGSYTLTAGGAPVSTGGSASTGGGMTSSTTSTSGTTGSSWYFGTTGSSTGGSTTMGTTSSTTTMTTNPVTNGMTYTLPDGTIITPQMVFQMMNMGTTGSSVTTPSVSLYKGKNLSSNIRFSTFSTTRVPFLTTGTLYFRYTYRNPNPTRTYRIERVLLNPLGTVVTRSVAQRTITNGQQILYSPSQYLPRTLSNGLYTMRVRITSLDGKTIYDENTFDLELKRK